MGMARSLLHGSALVVDDPPHVYRLFLVIGVS